MERSNQFSLIPVLILILLCLIPVHASVAAGYSYYVDYFKVEGSVNHQDDFNDGNMSPWVVDTGTAVESGGYVNLRNPGEVSIDGGTIKEKSDIQSASNDAFKIAIGAGNATATSRWITNVEPTFGQSYEMSGGSDFYPGNDANEISYSIGLMNADQAMVDYLNSTRGISIPVGIFAFFEFSVEESGVETFELQVAPIVDASVFDAGSLFLKLHYDDFAQEISASIVFGNDENAEAWEPFNKFAMPAYAESVFDEWGLEAKSISAVPIPAALPLFCSALGLFGFMGWKHRKYN